MRRDGVTAAQLKLTSLGRVDRELHRSEGVGRGAGMRVLSFVRSVLEA